jgi:gliotoxin biosynthesis cytochrome P450 monooxygenase
VIAVDLTRSIPAKVREKQEHCRRAFDRTIGACPEWKEVELFPAMMRTIAQTNACTFVGDELGTSERWIKSVERYPMAVMVACFALNALPSTMRPIFAPLLFLPAMYVQWDAKRMLSSVIKKNMHDYQSAADQKEYMRTKQDRQVPFTAWLMSRHKPGKATPYQLYVDILLASFESTASSASTLYNTVADLASHPEYVEILREELESVMIDGQLPMSNLGELKKMDSVMRESFRMTPFGLCMFVSQYPLFHSPEPKRH